MSGVIDNLQGVYEKKLRNVPGDKVNMNLLFLGNNGAKLVNLARLYGTLMADLGVLPSGEGKF